MTNASGIYSTRTMLSSFGLHGLALGLLLVLPAGMLRQSARPKELDVTFHRSTPRIERPAPAPAAAPAPLGKPAVAALRPGPIAPTAPPPVFRDPGPPALGDPLPPETPVQAAVEPPPQKRVEQAGILAFRDKFARLATENGAPNLGAGTVFRDADDVGQGGASSRSALTTAGPGGSGGINVASLSRAVGGGGGSGAGGGNGAGGTGVSVGRATSSIASIGEGDRPLSNGPGPSRTDEEIQIVFDRHKASFYRLYNRELRSDPTLQGQMVLKLTIEPDGSVSMCVLQSSDMNAPALSVEVVNRVRALNFGAKEGVQAVTIVYPIDFLPAA